MATHDQIPQYVGLMNPLLQALRELGGSGSVEEIASRVTESPDLPEEILALPHDPDKSSQTALEYRLAWARTYLRRYGLLENSARGVWALVAGKRNVATVDPQEVARTVREQLRAEREGGCGPTDDEGDTPDAAESWRSRLHHILTKEMSSEAFERLARWMLRESGFVQVEITGRSGDGGIDGKGIVRVGGLLSFHVLFQCKKYQGSVSAGAIRDFRGALIGRADKGLFITTGTFTRSATAEATRDGATPIDLMDGDELLDKLKELGLGVRTKMVESVEIDRDWFANV